MTATPKTDYGHISISWISNGEDNGKPSFRNPKELDLAECLSPNAE